VLPDVPFIEALVGKFDVMSKTLLERAQRLSQSGTMPGSSSVDHKIPRNYLTCFMGYLDNSF
jgi:hypothetical protein